MDYLITAKSFHNRINRYEVSEWDSEICEGLFSDRLEVARNWIEKNNYVKNYEMASSVYLFRRADILEE